MRPWSCGLFKLRVLGHFKILFVDFWTFETMVKNTFFTRRFVNAAIWLEMLFENGLAILLAINSNS